MPRETTIYDQFGAPEFINIQGVSVVGTQASLAAIAASTFRIPFRAKVLGATRVSTTGGTAAGPTVLLQRSVAGTGAWTSFGTAAFGTDADGRGTAFSVTPTVFEAGDHIRLAIAAGTAAATHTCNFLIEMVDLPY